MGNDVTNIFPILPIHSQTRKHTTCVRGVSWCTIWYTRTRMSGSFARLFVCKLASGWTGSGWSSHVCKYFLRPLRAVCELANAPKRELFAVDHMVHQHGLFVCLVGPGVPLRARKHYTSYIIPTIPNFAKEHGLRAVGGDVVYTAPPAFASVCVWCTPRSLVSCLQGSGTVCSW